MPPRSPSPEISHCIESVVATLSFRLPSAQDSTSTKKKGSASKGKLETKNKDFSFTFETSEANYLSFLSTILQKHGYDRYTPVVKERRFSIKVAIGAKKLKKDAIDLDTITEYKDLVKKILDDVPAKLAVFVNLDDVKAAHKKPVGHADDSSNDEASADDEEENDGKNAIDRELGRLRGLLEKKYQNPNDNGCTFVTNDGEKLPLTPAMMSEWCRAMYDGNATIQNPPNSQSFDPKMRARSIFQTPKTSSSGNEGFLQSFASILRDSRAILSGDIPPVTNIPATPTNTRPIPTDSSSAISASPPKPSPSKLPAFLKYAETHLGVKNAMTHEFSLEASGYGPDILQYIDNKDIVSCGVSAGDAVRLKRGAEKWWNSPEAKRARIDERAVGSPVRAATEAQRGSIRFEKRFKDGGSQSMFGSRIVVGDRLDGADFDWWYYNGITKRTERVPDGMMPELDGEYNEDHPV